MAGFTSSASVLGTLLPLPASPGPSLSQWGVTTGEETPLGLCVLVSGPLPSPRPDPCLSHGTLVDQYGRRFGLGGPASRC